MSDFAQDPEELEEPVGMISSRLSAELWTPSKRRDSHRRQDE
jgi:hypothetical protein